jgi:hypothetical protein
MTTKEKKKPKAVATVASEAATGEGLFSISALAELFESDRATVRKWLKGVTPAVSLPKLKQYRLTDKNKDGKTVKELLEQLDDPKLAEAKLRKLFAEAQRAELNLEIERGDRLLKSDVRNHAFDFVKAMFQRIAKRYPKENAPRLHRLRTASDLERTMTTDLSLIFDELKRDYPEIF